MKFWTRRPAVAAPAALAAGRAGIMSSVRPTPGRRRPRDGRIGRNAATMSVLMVAVVLAAAGGIPAGASVPAGAPGPGWAGPPAPQPGAPTRPPLLGSPPPPTPPPAAGTP